MGRRKGEKPEAVVERESRVWQLRCQGWTQPRIAGELGVDVSTVCKILQRVSRRTLARTADEVEAKKAEQDAQLEFIKAEALEAWERSKRNSGSETRESVETEAQGQAVGGGGSKRDRVTRVIAQRDGDPAYLAEARAALGDQRGLWGLDAPKRKEVTGKDGAPIQLSWESVAQPRGDQPNRARQRLEQEEAEAEAES